jgi:hypothetical protein
MSRYGKCVLTGVLLVVGYGLMVWGMGMMNRPSDVSLYLGMTVVFAVVAAGPLVVGGIWRR